MKKRVILVEEQTIPCIIIQPLGIQDVVHGYHIIVFAQSTASNSPEFLHVPADAQNETEMYAEGSNICSSLARDPENGKVAVLIELKELRFVDGTDSKLTFDSRNKRGSLEEGTSEGLESTGEGRRILEFVV